MEDTPNGAMFSPLAVYRYKLWRIWDKSKPMIMFICLNPSTADAVKNDPTITRCQVRAKLLGYGGMYFANIFAYKSTQIDGLLHSDDPIGNPENDKAILEMARNSNAVVCGWGNYGSYLNRSGDLVDTLSLAGIKLWCLGINRTGEPVHPLYVAYYTPIIPYERS